VIPGSRSRNRAFDVILCELLLLVLVVVAETGSGITFGLRLRPFASLDDMVRSAAEMKERLLFYVERIVSSDT
jgi:hypothetical protein